ncbi:hypothetical protein DOY81_010816, partial [Sarcophaga bullata]
QSLELGYKRKQLSKFGQLLTHLLSNEILSIDFALCCGRHCLGHT